MKKMDDLHTTENLLGSYNTEDEKLQICLKELTPLLNLLQFYRNIKYRTNEYSNIAIKNIDFTPSVRLLQSQYNLSKIEKNKQRKYCLITVAM